MTRTGAIELRLPRYGDKRVVCAGLAGMIFGGSLMASNLPLLPMGRVLSGAGAVLLSVLLTKMVTETTPSRARRTAARR